jgi:hypothetical protein
VTADTPARGRAGRRRSRLIPARPRAVLVRLTDQEYAELATAADHTGLTPTGYCAQAALDTARSLHTTPPNAPTGKPSPTYRPNCSTHTRVAINELRTELTRDLDTDNPVTVGPGQTLASAAQALTALDSVISRIHRQLGQEKAAAMDCSASLRMPTSLV